MPHETAIHYMRRLCIKHQPEWTDLRRNIFTWKEVWRDYLAVRDRQEAAKEFEGGVGQSIDDQYGSLRRTISLPPLLLVVILIPPWLVRKEEEDEGTDLRGSRCRDGYGYYANHGIGDYGI